jgi:hypothetical protein
MDCIGRQRFIGKVSRTNPVGNGCEENPLDAVGGIFAAIIQFTLKAPDCVRGIFGRDSDYFTSVATISLGCSSHSKTGAAT